MSRKICVVTGSRAEFGLMRWLMQGLSDASALELQTVVTGTHLSAAHGMTINEIIDSGFHIDGRVHLDLQDDGRAAIAAATGQATTKLAAEFLRLSPNIIVVLGDRFEVLAAASAALICGIPVAHLHGGEVTEGAFDESIRHAVTKMSHLHFVAADAYARRVVQLGENPDHVFTVGALGLDAIENESLLSREELQGALNFTLGAKNYIVTYHPETIESANPVEQLDELLRALDTLTDTHIVFTQPNADPGGQALTNHLTEFVATRPHTRLYQSLGHKRYLSCLKEFDAVIGNSSSGLIEAPSLHTATINIGDRQKGRLRAASVIDCAPDYQSISRALSRLSSDDFAKDIRMFDNPYGRAGASKQIIDVLQSQKFDNLLKKSFFNLH